MNTISAKKILKPLTPELLIHDTVIEFSACIHRVKNSGSFKFVFLRTGKYIFQGVHNPHFCEKEATFLKEGVYAKIKGKVREEKRAELGAEITILDFEILSSPDEEYPLPVSARVLDCDIDENIENRTTALRQPIEKAPFAVLASFTDALRNAAKNESFTEITTPVITNAEEPYSFKADYFGTDAYLSRSNQQYLQASVAFFDRVFEVSHCFRNEKRNSARLLNEFILFSFDCAFINELSNLMEIEMSFIKYAVQKVKKECEAEITLLEAKLPETKSAACITFDDAMKMLGKDYEQFDLDPTDEVRISDWAKEKYGCDFAFVTDFPAKKQPFYIRRNGNRTESFVLLLRGMEVSRGGLRINKEHEMKSALAEKNISAQGFDTLLDALKHGMPPHGGGSISTERFVMKLLGLSNIRQLSLFPRDIHTFDK